MRRIGFACFLAAAMPVAVAQNYGDWKVQATDDGSAVSAESMNQSGKSFGLMCFTDTGNCVWALVTEQHCENGATYPLMANAKAGSVSLQVKCGNANGDDPVLVFQDFDKVTDLVNQNDRVGFAIPMEDGMFSVVRFSLRGATQATRVAAEQAKLVRDQGTRDIKM